MLHTALSQGGTPSTVILSSQDFVAWLDQNKAGHNNQPRDGVPQFAGHDTAYVQLVLEIDDSALVWGTSLNKNSWWVSRLEHWLRPTQTMSDAAAREDVVRTFPESAQNSTSSSKHIPACTTTFNY